MFHHFLLNNATRGSILLTTDDMEYGWAGMPLVVGQVNMGGDAEFQEMAYGWAGHPFVTWSNV